MNNARAELRHAIVRSADALFTAEGVTPVSVEHVATHADLSPATVRSLFRTKQQLVIAALRYRHDDWMHALLAAEETEPDPRDQLLALFNFLETCFQDHAYRGCAFINGYGELGRTDPTIAELADEHLQQVERHVAVLCHEAALPAHLAPALTLLVQGAQVEAAIHRTAQPARNARTAAAMLIAVYDTTTDLF